MSFANIAFYNKFSAFYRNSIFVRILAKFGAVYVNKLEKKYAYYTLEKSYNGYMMGSTDVDRHFNLGKREDMSKEAFVKEMCETLEIDETMLEEKVELRVRS